MYLPIGAGVVFRGLCLALCLALGWLEVLGADDTEAVSESVIPTTTTTRDQLLGRIYVHEIGIVNGSLTS